ncbi:penicillin-binding protein [Arcanobacterium haemolyticum]|nr:penicillin-binding protein [Arcanobacterium haemolyticum]
MATTSRSGSRAGASQSAVQKKGSGRKRVWNYPRRGLGPVRRWLPSWRFLVASFFAFVALCAATFAALYIFIRVPDPSDFALAQRTTVYYSDGETVMGTFADYDREPVELSTLPDYVSQAVVASEDQSFYTNNGIDLGGIVRALVNNVTGGARQGGSTLTQQYVERFYLGTTTGYAGKVKEAILALKIDRQQSKEQILENYLNTIYFGRGAYGIEIASQKYFGIPASQLNLSQTALLVGVIPAPSAWDPEVNAERAQDRWARVLRNMVDEGYISQSEADAQTFPETQASQASSSYAGPTGYLLSTVTSELTNSGKFTSDELNTGGYKIVTTIDKEKQQAAIDAVDALPEDRPDNNYVGLVSVDPRTGGIYAMYGGADYLTRARNAVTQDRAQGGSTFKPFALLTALNDGTPLTTRYPSYTPMKIGDIEVQNFDSRNYGRINLLTATKYSVNTVYVQLNQDIGPANTRQTAIKAGLPEDTPGLDDTTTNVLGSASPHPIDMAKVYATFANQGVQHDIYMVKSVSDPTGKEVYSGDNPGTRVFESDVMAQLTYALQEVTKRGATGETAGELGRPVAGKTGTSSGPWSAWFCGYIPQMVTIVDMYQIGPNGEEEVLDGFGEYSYGIGGGSFPAEIWLNYMESATEGMEVEEFPELPRNTPTYAPNYREPATVEETVEPEADEAPEVVQPTQQPAETPVPVPTPTQAPAVTTPPAEVPGDGGGDDGGVENGGN